MPVLVAWVAYEKVRVGRSESLCMCVRECKEHRERERVRQCFLQRTQQCDTKKTHSSYVCWVCASHRAQKCRRLASHACFAHTFYFFVIAAVYSSGSSNSSSTHGLSCTPMDQSIIWSCAQVFTEKHVSKAVVRGSQIAVIYIRVKRDSQENFVLVNSFYDTTLHL